VITLAADAMVDQGTKQPFYRAEIVLEEGEIAKLTHETLLPGMPVQAFIETGARTPMAYLLQPFTDYFRTALRES
jgi:HlyD family secretion protein